MTEAQMGNEKAFSGFDFGNTWYIDELSGYDYPQLKRCPQERISGCELTALPEKLEYSDGERLDLSGGVLSVNYENGMKSSVALEESMVSGYDADQPGRQTVTVSCAGSTVSFEIEVKEVPAESLKLDCEKTELEKGRKLQLKALFTPLNVTDKNLTWETDNELVATVSEDGEVKGISAGEAVITAETANGITSSCTVKVCVPAKKLKLSAEKLQLKKGQKKTVKATMTPLDATDTITWLSSNSKIASVNSRGVVTARKQGSAVIMAKTSSGVSKKIKVTVTNNGTAGGNLTWKQAGKILRNWLEKNKLYNEKYHLAFERKEGGKYLFHYYEDMPDHTATINWYYVDSKTGKITVMTLAG